MASNYQTMSIEQIQDEKVRINDELIESMSLTDNAIFDQFQFEVITDLENKEKQYRYDGYQNIARGYEPGDSLVAKQGEFSESEIRVETYWTRVLDNIQNYRRKVMPYSVAGVSSTGNVLSTNAEDVMRKLADRFGDQVRLNLFFGDRNSDEAKALGGRKRVDGYGLYDGIFAKIKAAHSAGLLSTAKQNYFACDLALESDNPVDTYEGLYAFYCSLSSYMQDPNRPINFALPVNVRNRALEGFMMKFNQLQVSAEQMAQNPKFFQMPNVNFVTNSCLGKGNGVLAYTGGNLVYATDLTRNGEPEGAFIHLDKAEADANLLIYQMQAASGTGIRDFGGAYFACSEGIWDAFVKPDLTNGVITNGDADLHDGSLVAGAELPEHLKNLTAEQVQKLLELIG